MNNSWDSVLPAINRFLNSPSSSLIFFASLFVLIFASSFHYHKKEKQALDKLSSFLQGKVSRYSYLMTTFKGNYQGLGLSVILYPGEKGGPSFLAITLAKNSSLHLRIFKKSFSKLLNVNFGVEHDVKTDDQSFNEEFWTWSNNVNLATGYLNNSGFKNIIRDLFNQGLTSIEIDGKRIATAKPNYRLENDLLPQNLMPVIEKLNTLAKGL